jgi:NADPH:quinone reductase-like Zn-dependent oxidoreductase
VGDRVMGFQGLSGVESHAQYLVFPEAHGIVTIPGGFSYEEAAACIEGAFYASVAMRCLRPGAGQKALVYGATGAIGSAYVQFLKHAGLYVTAVCGGEHRTLVASLGADKVVDYKTEDFTADRERYDYVFDAVGKTSFAQCKRLLAPNGKYSWAEGAVNILLALLTPLLGGKKVVFCPPKDAKGGLLYVREVMEQGGFRPLIDRVYPVSAIREAFTYTASGQKVGNVVLTGIA